MASRTTLWRYRTGRSRPRPAPPGADPAWCATRVGEIDDWADHGMRQALAFARRVWGSYDLDATDEQRREWRAIARARICDISAHRHRDRPGFMVTAGRYAVQSYIKQHVVGWQSRRAYMPADDDDDTLLYIDDIDDVVAQLIAHYPAAFVPRWRDRPEETAARIRAAMGGA